MSLPVDDLIEACAQALRTEVLGSIAMRGLAKDWDRIPEKLREDYRREAGAVLACAEGWRARVG